MKRTLEIEFLLDNAKTKTLSLTDPKDDISATAVQTWAENVVAKKALLIGAAPSPSPTRAPASARSTSKSSPDLPP